ncbi:reverse transcriptase domain-containing protein [Tanacetum coccineum]
MGRNIEVNVDDMVIKSDSEEEIMADITETLERLRAINLKLTLKKCSFGVEEGIYLVHLITKQGIRADPSKVKVVSTLRPPKTVSEMQNLNKKIAALNEAFQRMKECLESLPTMVIPTKGETLTMYLATLEENVSAILMAERGKKQILVYFKHYLRKTRKQRTKNLKEKKPKPENAWKLFTDGASSSDGLGAGLMVVSLEGKEYTYALRFEFKTTNNKTEYEALLAGLRIGIDIVGPLPTAPGGARFLVIAIDYFTKWVEAKPLISTTGKHMEKFVWEHIVCRFGRPQVIISDNGKQFVKGTFLVFCKKLGTLQASTSVYHPQANGQSSNGETPFSLVYGSKAVIPIEISMETKRVQDFDPKDNKKRRREDPNILKEKERNGIDKRSPLQTEAGGYYNKNVKLSTFKPGTYVLRLNSVSKAEYQGKWDPHGKDLT